MKKNPECPRCQRDLADSIHEGIKYCSSEYEPDEVCDIVALMYAQGLVDGETIAREYAYPVRGREHDDDSVCFDEAEAELKRCLEACK